MGLVRGETAGYGSNAVRDRRYDALVPGRPARYTACGTPISSKAGQTASDTPHPATDEGDQFYGSDIDRFYISTTIPLKILVKEDH